MCGINGQFAYHYAASPVDRQTVERVRDSMALRGPDGFGYWQSADARLALAHRRLSIIDLDPRAAQPMATADTTQVISFNGEIYNYPQIKQELIQLGVDFRTQSDTEVLLLGYRHFGLPGILQRLRGMYAFALYDQNTKQLHLARDPYGIKPLYVADDGWRMHFASSVKALKQVPGVDLTLDSAAQVGFYLWASVPEPFSWYRGIRALPAGHYQTISAAGVAAPKRFYSLAEHYQSAKGAEDHRSLLSDADAQARVSAALQDSVQAHLTSDVPVGAFLSAGVDSGALVALMRQQSDGEIRTCTLRFAEFVGTPNDESPIAEEIAKRYQTRHETVTISQSEFVRHLPALLAAMDQPSIDGFNSYLVSAVAARAGLKVALSGVGGDELFAGYGSFTEVPKLYKLRYLARLPLISTAFRQAARGIAFAAGLNPKAPAVFELGRAWLGCYQIKRGLFMPWELRALLPPEVVRDGLARLQAQSFPAAPLSLDAASQVSVLESTRYLRNQLLRDTDWASMAHSLEVRTPMVDVALHRALAPMLTQFQNGAGKRWIAGSPDKALPEHIWKRAKTGFSTPVATWLKTDPQFDSWRKYGFLADKRQHWSRRFAVAIAEQYSEC